MKSWKPWFTEKAAAERTHRRYLRDTHNYNEQMARFTLTQPTDEWYADHPERLPQ